MKALLDPTRSWVVSAALWLGVVAAVGADGVGTSRAAELQVFKTWLDRTRPGYGCDEGPAAFRNPTVAVAYPGRRFYYVLTYARGIPPPFQNGVSMVATVDEGGEVHPLRDVASLREGLRKAISAKDARLAAAAALILSSGDPGERRWKLAPDSFRAKRTKTGWVCSGARATSPAFRSTNGACSPRLRSTLRPYHEVAPFGAPCPCQTRGPTYPRR